MTPFLWPIVRACIVAASILIQGCSPEPQPEQSKPDVPTPVVPCATQTNTVGTNTACTQ